MTGSPSPLLLSPARLRSLELRNRTWLAPMCQYMVEAEDGVPTDWHLVHLGARAAGGFGLVVTEATAVSPEGRISPRDTGLWTDEQTRAWARIVDFCHARGAATAVQLAHAGRKASTWPSLPAFADRRGSVPASDSGWTTVGPTTDPFPGLEDPAALTTAQITGVVDDFVRAARRAREAGFDAVELHFAHGYLVHQFLSPLVNTRTDGYGGTPANRRRLAGEIAAAVREVWPAHLPVIARISATDWVEGGWDLEGSRALATDLERLGVDALHVSTGGAVPAKIPVGPGYQLEFARALRGHTGMAVAAVGLLTGAEQAEQVLRSGDADFVAVGRAALRDPAWPQRAAHELGVRDPSLLPDAYRRGAW